MAPELLKNDYYSNKVDIWSLGVLVYYLVCGIDQEHTIPSSFLNGLSG
jgi:serine/threonine protein kinase